MAVGDKFLGAEGHWLMGRVMPRQFLDGVGKHLHHFAPEREDEVMAAIKARAEEIVEEDKDLETDGPSKGEDALDKLEMACRKMQTFYPAYFEWDFGRPDPGTFDMKVKRCFFRDFSTATTPGSSRR